MNDDSDGGRIVGLVISAALLLIIGLPTLLSGTGGSFLGLGIAAIAAIGFGAFLRKGQTGAARPIGSIVVALGATGLLAVAVLFWLVLNGLGRPM